MTVNLDSAVTTHLIFAQQALNQEISHLQISIFSYGIMVVLEILLALAMESWYFLIPAALFGVMMITDTIQLIKCLKSREQLSRTISQLTNKET